MTTTPVAPSFWAQLLTRRMLICVVIGFSSGLPLFILLNLLPAWLKAEGVNIKTIGAMTLVQLPYTLKVLWAPLLDRFSAGNIGRRRFWMLLSQALLLLCIPLWGWLQPQADIELIAYTGVLIALLSATQDMAIDAYRREILSDTELALGSTLHVNAYKLAALVPGSLALVLSDHLPWRWVFVITALFMLPGLLLSVFCREPQRALPPRNLQEAVVQPFLEFFRRKGWQAALLVLAFMLLYKLGDSMATALATPFYMDLGFSRTDIGLLAKNAGLWANIAGGLVGGVWMVKLGINRGLWVFGVAQWLVILGFAGLALAGKNHLVLALVIASENFAVGLGTAAFTAYMMRECHPAFAAFQFALFSSLMAVPRTFIAASTGYLSKALGWPLFFVLCFALALPGMLLLPKIAPWPRRARQGVVGPS